MNTIAERIAEATAAVGDIAKAAPSEIDTVLAVLNGLRDKRESYIDSTVAGIHRALGERPYRVRGTDIWPTGNTEAIAAARAKAADPAYRTIPGSSDDVRPPLDLLDRYTAELAEICEAQAPFDAEYSRRPWPRYFWVTAHGGHCHSSMSCSTCNKAGKRTTFDWTPELSGLSAHDAVAKYGPTLCTVCYPDAPASMTCGRTAERCSGSRTAPVEGTERRVGIRVYGECTGCHDDQLLSGSYVRAHKPPKKAAA